MTVFGRRARCVSVVLALGGLLLLTACGGTAGPPPPTSALVERIPPPPTAVPTNPQARPPDEPAAPNVAVVPPVPPSGAAGPPQDVQRLIGLKGDFLREWMGDTVFVRHDGIAEIWRFASDTCFLDVFLYRERDGLRVAHLDARSRNGNQRIVAQSCYGLILAAHSRPARS